MNHKPKSIRPFIGAKDFEQSRKFYRELGFEEIVLFHNMSLFKTEGLGFYLQDAYVKDWIDNLRHSSQTAIAAIVIRIGSDA